MAEELWAMLGSGGEEERILGQQTLAAIDQREVAIAETMRGPKGLAELLELHDGTESPEAFASLPRDTQTAILNLASMALTRLAISAADRENDKPPI